MYEKIIIISPTRQEIEPFLQSDYMESGCQIHSIEICGVGMAEAGAAVGRVLCNERPSLVIMAGIAGCYPGSPFRVGDVALVEREKVADLGAIHPAGFRPMYMKHYRCPFARGFKDFRIATSNTVSTAAAPFVEPEGTDLENMEGAVFFSICLGSDIPFLEMRAVSNPVCGDRRKWDIPLATENLSVELNKLLRTIAKTYR